MPATTRVTCHIGAPRERVYGLLVDAQAVRQWKVPDDMSSEIHCFDAREGGAFRVSLTYHAGDAIGKTEAKTDTYQGHFVALVPPARVVEVMAFETTDPTMRGQMTVTCLLTEAPGGTDLMVTHEGLPEGIAPSDNEQGWRMALARLKALAERDAE